MQIEMISSLYFNWPTSLGDNVFVSRFVIVDLVDTHRLTLCLSCGIHVVEGLSFVCFYSPAIIRMRCIIFSVLMDQAIVIAFGRLKRER